MQGPSGFDQAIITKVMLFLTAAFSFCAQLAHKTQIFELDLPAIGRGEIWRIFTHQLVYSTPSELILGSILIYNWRMFERQFGVRKFGACILFFNLVGTILQASILGISRSMGSYFSFAMGPYTIIFGFLALFYFDIPQSTPFTFIRIPLSDKLFIYILALQIFFSNWPLPAYTSLIGLFLGILYRLEFLPFHRLRIPSSISSLCGSLFRPILNCEWLRLFGIGNQSGGGAAGGVRFNGGGHRLGSREIPQGEILNAPVPAGGPSMIPINQNVVIVNEIALQQIIAMGFSEPRARAALITTNNNVAMASNLLIGS